jgi:hypothetical protein
MSGIRMSDKETPAKEGLARAFDLDLDATSIWNQAQPSRMLR